MSLSRHKRNCSICAHEKRNEIEAEFVAWRSPEALAQEYGFADRASVYRHAHALGLFVKRQRNIRAALERIIERVGDVEITCSAVVAAIQAYAKINAAGQWIDPSDRLTLHDLYQRMSPHELNAYALDGKLPQWFSSLVNETDIEDVHDA